MYADKVVETPKTNIHDKTVEFEEVSSDCVQQTISQKTSNQCQNGIDYTLQAVRQMIYNQWQDDFGYIISDGWGQDLLSEVKNMGIQKCLMLSDEYLTLSKPIVESPATKSWERFDETWDKYTQACAEDVLTIADKNWWFEEFDKQCDEFFMFEFRNYGVRPFFKTFQHQELYGYAQTIRRKIEKKLFDEWGSGTKGILQIAEYTELLIEDCTKRIDIFEHKKAWMEEELTDINEEIQKISLRWKESLFVRVFNSIPMLDRYQHLKSCYYTIITKAEAYGYAKELLQQIIVELNNMRNDILSFKNELHTIMQKLDDMELDNKISKQFIDRDKIPTIAATIRTRLIRNLGENTDHTFVNLHGKSVQILSHILKYN